MLILWDAAPIRLAFLWQRRHNMRAGLARRAAMAAIPFDTAQTAEAWLVGRRRLPGAASPSTGTPFQPLDPGIVNAAIPAFFIGRNAQGFWVARDVRGQVGGIFLLERSALSFAKRNSEPAGCATIFPSERFELDLENGGNPLIVRIGSLQHLAMRSC